MTMQEGQSVSLNEVRGTQMTARAKSSHHKPERLVSELLTHTVLIILSLIFMLPFFWMLTGSVKTDAQLTAFPIVWFPNLITLQNYIYGLQAVPFILYLGNSLLICFCTSIGTLFSCSFVAYGLSRIDWPLRTPLFVIILSTTMLPFYVTMVPLFTIFRALGWINTYLPLIVPSFLGTPLFIFLLRQFFLTIPRDLSDAARVDGANELIIYFRVVLPLAKPALAAVALFQFLAAWNAFLEPLIYLNNSQSYTASLGLSFFQNQYTSEYGAIMAASTVMIIPVIFLFFFAQRTFIQGITLTGVKG